MCLNLVQMLSPRSHEAIEHREKVKKRRLPDHLKPYQFQKGHKKTSAKSKYCPCKGEKKCNKPRAPKKTQIKAPIIKV